MNVFRSSLYDFISSFLHVVYPFSFFRLCTPFSDDTRQRLYVLNRLSLPLLPLLYWQTVMLLNCLSLRFLTIRGKKIMHHFYVHFGRALSLSYSYSPYCYYDCYDCYSSFSIIFLAELFSSMKRYVLIYLQQSLWPAKQIHHAEIGTRYRRSVMEMNSTLHNFL